MYLFEKGDAEVGGRLLENPDFMRFLELLGVLADASGVGFIDSPAESFELYLSSQARFVAFGEAMRLAMDMSDSGGDRGE